MVEARVPLTSPMDPPLTTCSSQEKDKLFDKLFEENYNMPCV